MGLSFSAIGGEGETRRKNERQTIIARWPAFSFQSRIARPLSLETYMHRRDLQIPISIDEIYCVAELHRRILAIGFEVDRAQESCEGHALAAGDAQIVEFEFPGRIIKSFDIGDRLRFIHGLAVRTCPYKTLVEDPLEE